MVPMAGLEPAHIAAVDFESTVSAYSTTSAHIKFSFLSRNTELKILKIGRQKVKNKATEKFFLPRSPNYPVVKPFERY